MMGIVSVWDISSIQDPAKRAVAERAAMRIGVRWLMERKSVTGAGDLVRIVQEETRGITV
jgi:5-methylthioribose kinase